jgi:type IV secretion system protein VirB9
MSRVRLAFLALLVAAPALAQMRPLPGDGDSRLQQVDYSPGQIVQLRGAPGYELMIELSPDEQVQNIALGDSAAWQVSVSKSGDRLFLRPAQADAATNMTVVTSVRVYNFDLAALPGPAPDMPYTIQFRYPPPKSLAGDPQYVDVSAISRRLSHYRVGGDRQLWPTSVGDDGQHTYIIWPRTAAIPAVYAPDRFGNEALVNGMMGTDDVYVVDGVPQMLTFRIDRSVAWAKRINPRKRR